jgi:hypothetical protein
MADPAKRRATYEDLLGHVWLVDPLTRTLEAYRLEGDRWMLLATWRDDASVRAEPFDAIELELGALWAR